MDGQLEAQTMKPRGCLFRRLARLFSLANLILLFSCCATCGAGSLLRSDSTVVLLSGLPGDLESEFTYRDQFQSWLEILHSVRPKQILALNDAPDSVTLPRGA